VTNSQIETGTPYMLYKDACNLKSNQQNLGVIKSSNLCTGASRRRLGSCGLYGVGRDCAVEGLCDLYGWEGAARCWPCVQFGCAPMFGVLWRRYP